MNVRLLEEMNVRLRLTIEVKS